MVETSVPYRRGRFVPPASGAKIAGAATGKVKSEAPGAGRWGVEQAL